MHATNLGLQITVDHVEAVQIGESEHYLRCIELPLVVGESVGLDNRASKYHRLGRVAGVKYLGHKPFLLMM